MLQQEQSIEPQDAPLTLANILPSTKEELASAIIAREDREQAYALISTDAERMAKTIEPLGLDISPEELLAEVREQRRQTNQEKVMSKRKNGLNGTSLAFLGGMVGACCVALFLVYTNYLTFLKYQDLSSDVMQRNQQDAIKRAAMVSPQDLLTSWSYPMAQVQPLRSGGAMVSASMTVKDSYLTVWKYYARKIGGDNLLSSLHMPDASKGIAPSLSYNFNNVKNLPQANDKYDKIESQSGGEHPITYFTEHAGPNTVTVMVTPGAAQNTTEITIYAMNSE